MHLFLEIGSMLTIKAIPSHPMMGHSFSFNNWTWISIIEFLLLLFLLFKGFSRKKVEELAYDKDREILKNARKNATNMGSLMHDIHQSPELYDQLKVKVHPDRFVSDEEKQKIATILFQSIEENKTTYAELLKLKDDAIRLLGIKI
jgi:hypothetical protein